MVAVIAVAVLGSTAVLADGTEILNPPSIAIASGSGIVTSGIGLVEDVGVFKPGSIVFNVPGNVEQALLYWSGRNRWADPPGDMLIVNGVNVFGTLIGGPVTFVNNGDRIISYRADITALGLVSPGANVLNITGTLFADFWTSGAGVVVIYNDGSGAAIDIRDGLDTAYSPAPIVPEQITVPQMFSFPAAVSDRMANLSLFVTEVGDFLHAGRIRTSTVRVTLSNALQIDFVNELQSLDGALWDNFVRPIMIPAGVDSLTVEIISDGNDPASAMWLAAALSVEEPFAIACTPGFWKNTRAHIAEWTAAGFAPGDSFDVAMGGCVSTGLTMDQALEQRGGQEGKLSRFGAASLLNAAHPDVDTGLTVGDVISIFCNAYAAGDWGAFDGYFPENRDCPIDD